MSTWLPQDEDMITDGYFQCGPGLKQRKRFNIGRDLMPVGVAVRAAVDYRNANAPKDKVFIAVFAKCPDGIMARFSAAISPGTRTAAWELSG